MNNREWLKQFAVSRYNTASPDAIFESTVVGDPSPSARRIAASRLGVPAESISYGSETLNQGVRGLVAGGTIGLAAAALPAVLPAVKASTVPFTNAVAKMVTRALGFDIAQKAARMGIGDEPVDSALNLIEPLAVIAGSNPLMMKEASQSISAAPWYAKHIASRSANALAKASRFNESHFKDPNTFYRVVAGDAAFDDIVTTGVVSAKSRLAPSNIVGGLELGRRPTASPSFSKGRASLNYSLGNPDHYVITTKSKLMMPSTQGRHGKGTTMFPTGENGRPLRSLSGEDVDVYKHVGDMQYDLVYRRGVKLKESNNLVARLINRYAQKHEMSLLAAALRQRMGL